MGQAALNLPMTASEFLAWDATQTIKHEYVRGELFAMAGAGEGHVTVALNIAMHFRQQLAGTPCRTFISDMKVQVGAADAFYYPDVIVTCSATDARDPLVKREPLLLVEVLWPSTMGYDCGDKFGAYRKLTSLREYLLVDVQAQRCDLYRLNDQGLWVLHPFERGETVELGSLALQLTPAVLWAELPQPAP